MVFSKQRSVLADAYSARSDAVPAEHVIARLRPHARILVAPSIVLIASAGAVGYFAGNLPEAWQNNVIIAGAVVVAVVLWLVPMVTWLSQRYVITTRRIIVTRGFFVRRRTELLHNRSHEITLRRTVLQTVFRTGNLVIKSDGGVRVTVRDVPGALHVHRALHDLIEEHDVSVSHVQSYQTALAPDFAAWGPR